MTLIKTSLLNGIAVAIKMFTLLGINKILAVYVGPSGYAVIGQFQNAIQITTTFASGAINTGVVKYTAEYYDDIGNQRAVWRTAGTIALIGSLGTGFLIIILHKFLGQWILKDQVNSTVFIWFGATLTFFVLNAFLLAILNGKKDIFHYIIANIAGSLFSLAIIGVMTVYFGLYGALVALATYQSLTFIVTVILCRGARWFKVRYLLGRIDKQAMINLGNYTAMALTSAACVPISQILIRNYLGEVLGWSDAGYWEAMTRISSTYLLLITTTLSLYYLPRLSEIRKSTEIISEIIMGYKIIIPVVATCGLLLYIVRARLVTILFADSFAPMQTLFAWQMIGDTLKIGGWITAYVMLGRAMTLQFIATEITFSGFYVIASLLFIKWIGIQGPIVAYALTYLLYWPVIYYLVMRHLHIVEHPVSMIYKINDKNDVK